MSDVPNNDLEFVELKRFNTIVCASGDSIRYIYKGVKKTFSFPRGGKHNFCKIYREKLTGKIIIKAGYDGSETAK